MNIQKDKNLVNPLIKKSFEMPPEMNGAMPPEMNGGIPPEMNGGAFPQRSPFSKVEGYTNLIRDEQTKAVLNTNINEYKSYKDLKKIKEFENSRINNLENDMSNIKNDLSEIKSLLRNLANGS